MAYPIKSKKEKPKFSEREEYLLVDIKRKIYDTHSIKGWKKAVHLNLAYQIGSGNDYVIPMQKSWVLKDKQLKKQDFL